MPERVIKQLDSVSKNRRPRLNPVFAGVGVAGALTAWAADDGVSESTSLWVTTDNNNISVENFPLVVGEAFGICEKDDITSIANLRTGADVEVNPIITKIVYDTNELVRVDFVATRNSATNPVPISIDKKFVLYSAAIDTARPTTANTLKKLDAYGATFTMSNVELIVQNSVRVLTRQCLTDFAITDQWNLIFCL